MPVRDIPFLDKDQNIVAWVDRQLMPNHLYEDSTTHNLRDPEGLLSDIPALGTALLGLLAALWLRSQREQKIKAIGLAIGSAALLASGYFWSIWFPLNKKMWTSTFVLVAAGWSMAIFALAYWAVEVKGWGKADSPTRKIVWPWLVFGSNAIAAYMVSELIPGINDLFHVNFKRSSHVAARVGARSYLRSHTRPRLGLLRLFRLLCGSLLYPGLDPLSQEDLHQGVSRMGKMPMGRKSMKFRGIALGLFAGDLEFTIYKGSSAGRKPGAGWERTNY